MRRSRLGGSKRLVGCSMNFGFYVEFNRRSLEGFEREEIVSGMVLVALWRVVGSSAGMGAREASRGCSSCVR